VIVKVCGVRTAEIAEAAADAGADWIGIVFERRSARYADDRAAREVRAAAGTRLDVVGVFVDPDLATCEEAADRYRLSAVQVHGDVDPGFVERCSVPVIRGINIVTAQEAFTLGWWPDALLLVDGRPEPGELPGGTGNRVPAAVARDLAGHRKIVLAGGLDGPSVSSAIREVRPYGVDASSGLESAPGVKDAERVRDFVSRARAAFSDLQSPGP